MGCYQSTYNSHNIAERIRKDIYTDMTPSKQLPESLKFCLTGSSTVGKSRFFSSFFEVPYAANTGISGENDIKKLYLKKHNTTFSIFLWDTAGQEKHKSITRIFYSGVIGIFLLFDIKNASSFEALKMTWLPNILESVDCTKVKIIVLANKFDLHDPNNEDEIKLISEAKNFSEKNGLLFATSNSMSKDSVLGNIKILLEEIVESGLVHVPNNN